MHAYLSATLSETAARLYPGAAIPTPQIDKPRLPEHGDAATNLALVLSKSVGKNPRQVAQELVDAFPKDDARVAALEIAGPGFINFRFAAGWLQHQVRAILDQPDFGKTAAWAGKKVLVEFVSANPTGPLTVGHGRNAVLGDTLARLFEWIGAEVTREYYFNNAGRQMRVLGESVAARYHELSVDLGGGVGDGVEIRFSHPFHFPEGGYEGDYIRDIAREYVSRHGVRTDVSQDDPSFKAIAEELIFADIQRTLDRMQIRMDSFFNEDDLYRDGSLERVLDGLRAKDLVYDQDGAVWYRTTAFGKEKDTVLVKSTGEPTYRLPDIAYHVNKLERKYDRCVDIFGADHIATYPDVLSALKALGYDEQKVDVLVYQFVTIVQDGKPFKMSTRKANFVTLDELMDEVGADVTRFFFLMRSPGTHLEFDIAQAKEAGEKNPVFYLQYAHARIRSILRKVEEAGVSAEADLGLLAHESELGLIKQLIAFPDAISSAAESKEPHRLINHLNETAVAFHKFYHDCRILGEAPALAAARTGLLHATARVLRNGLGILGISAPESM